MEIEYVARMVWNDHNEILSILLIIGGYIVLRDVVKLAYWLGRRK